jgi:hypothetical protein
MKSTARDKKASVVPASANRDFFHGLAGSSIEQESGTAASVLTNFRAGWNRNRQ